VLARRRLERDLHDGAQQQLLAVAATLARAELLDEGSGRAAAVIEARQQLGNAIAELRRLARGIHPAVLDRGGLPAALGTLADVVAVPVEVDVPAALADTRLPLPIETTLWFVASEAVTNAVRHSGADRIRLRLRAGAAWTTLRVEDDGRGGAHLRSGGGLTGLADRVSALGGTLSVASYRAIGTRVEAVLPCGS
jgi:signal transduction histidine kinase